MEKPFISVVVTVLNMQKTISACLDSIIAQDYPKDRYEIVITDAGSTDGTVETIKRYIEETKTADAPSIRMYTRKGWPSAGRNEALRHVCGEFIAVTDADMIVPENWLSDYVEVMHKLGDDKIAGIGGPNISATNDVASRSVACIPTHGPTFDEVPVIGKNRYGKDFVTDTFIYATVCRNSFYRKSALDRIGWFDERFFGAEDPELNCRLLKSGYKLAYTRKAVVRHHHHSTVRSFFRQQTKYALWQAVANKLHPEMRSKLHPMPFIAALGFIGLTLISLFLFPPLMYALYITTIMLAAGFLGYGVKCAVLKRDGILVLSVPFFTFLWQMAWVFGYPTGLLTRNRLLAHGKAPVPIDKKTNTTLPESNTDSQDSDIQDPDLDVDERRATV